jgi:hypothetical protein
MGSETLPAVAAAAFLMQNAYKVVSKYFFRCKRTTIGTWVVRRTKIA